MEVAVREVGGAEDLAEVDSAEVGLVVEVLAEDLAAVAAAVAVSAAAARAAVGEVSVSIRSTRILRWLRR